MKPTLLTALFSLVFSTPQIFAQSELDQLHSKLLEQERLIRQLQQENQQLRKSTGATASSSRHSTAQAAPSASTTTYTVRAGDSLGKIAKRYKCSIDQIVRINRLKNASVIRIGQKLKIPSASLPSESNVSNDSSNLAGKTHRISEGETYFSIARKHGTSAEALIAANPTIKATALRPGQVIKLAPLGAAATPVLHSREGSSLGKMAASQMVTATPEPPAQASRPEPVAAPQVEPRPATPTTPVSTPAPVRQSAPAPEEIVSSSKQHTRNNEPERKIRSVSIEGEMSYGDFAKKYGTDITRLNDLNGLDLNKATVLAKGSELYVPAQP
ncbi:MAG: LysM peptidoglycan-binding domain-containing protein [Verrucomicrobiales bacterium]|nr:LysM peptidoglycan-binding domain-containing protein [Verrucomicrobiota bacterium JB025]